MEVKESNRRLAAILFTDIVGYTAMMQQDEKLAMAAVRKHHAVIEKCVPAHGGLIQQYYGDGCLSIFNSATDAVQCAFEFQKELLKEPVVLVRSGIHIGEIYSEGDKIFGDGVNLASRIESIGQGGTVLFSRDVYEKVRNHTEFEIRSVGSFEFKNVNDPIEVFALVHPEIRPPDVKSIEGKLKEQHRSSRRAWYLSGTGLVLLIAVVLALYLYPKDAITSPESMQYTSSIAVLPFRNIGNNPDEDFLSTGLAEDILTQLAQIDRLKVIARTSSMKFKDYESEGRSLMDVAKELGVTNILEGSVQRAGTRLRFTVRLVDPKEGSLLWAEDFDREIEDVLNVQREIALAVSNKLKVSLNPELRRRLQNTNVESNVNPDAYVYYHKGMEALIKSSGSQQEVAQAKTYFEMSIAADSTYSRAWVGLADAYLEYVYWHRAADGDALPLAEKAAKKALALDGSLGDAYGALGTIDLYENQLHSAKRNLQRALELNPNNAFVRERLSWVAFFTGDEKEGFAQMEKAILLDPLSTRYKGSMGSAYYMTGKYDEGIARMQQFLKLHPADNFLLWALGYLYAGKGEYEKAIAALDQRTIGKGTNWVYAYCYGKLGKREEAQKILDHLLERKKSAFVPDFMMAVVYTALEGRDDAIACLEHASGAGGESFFAWGIRQDPMFKALNDDPRFQTIAGKIEQMYENQ